MKIICEFFKDKACTFYRAYFSKIQLTEIEKNSLFPATLFIALMYIIYGDTDKRWKQIRWAIENKTMLEGAIRAVL